MADKQASYTPTPHMPREILERYEAVVAVMSGQVTVSEAARRLGLSRNHFQTLMHRGQGAMIEALTPKPAGRPPVPEREQQLQREVEQLRRENRKLSERTETTDRLLQVASGLLRGRVQASGRTPRTKTPKANKPPTEEPPDGLVEGARQMRAIGLTATLAAAVIGKSASTLRRWMARQRAGLVLRTKPGPAAGGAVDARCASEVEDLVRRTGGMMGAATLGHAVAGMSRRAAASIKARVLTRMERERRSGCTAVTVTQPGVVRGFDQLWAHTTDGLRPVLVSGDACVPYRTSLAVADRYDSPAVARAIDEDFRHNGAPLVWRADRASCHRTDEIDELLLHWGVLRLHGPPHLPRYYGQLERQNREHRAWLSSWPTPSPAALVDGCECMRCALNEAWPRRSLGWMTAAQKWAARPELCDDRAQLRASVADRAARLRRAEHSGKPLDDQLVERLAIEHELTERGYLRQKPGGWC